MRLYICAYIHPYNKHIHAYSLVENRVSVQPHKPINSGSVTNRDPWGHRSRFVRPGGRPSLVGHWSRFVSPLWYRFQTRTRIKGPRSWPTTFSPGLWLESGLKDHLLSWFQPRTETNEMPIYTSLPASRAMECSGFFGRSWERALWCSSSPPMHTRCSIKC
jgi:hypothetical protein